MRTLADSKGQRDIDSIAAAGDIASDGNQPSSPAAQSTIGAREIAEPSAPLLPPPSYDDAITDTHSGLEEGQADGAVAEEQAESSSAPYVDRNQAELGPFGTSKHIGPSSPVRLNIAEMQPLLVPSLQPQNQRPSTLEHGVSPDDLSPRDFFASLEYKRSSKGYSSSDIWLNTDARALRRFINECNERPRVAVEVVGSHTESKIVESTTTENGQTRRVTHTHENTVVDFKFTLELTPYIHERGSLYTTRAPNGEPYDFDKLLADYVQADNVLKEIKVQKKVIWDYELVRREITSFIKSAGYPHRVTVSFPMENDGIVVRSHNTISKLWRHPVTSFLCFVTCACLVGWPLQYFATKRWRNKLMSDFVVLASPRDYVDRNSAFIRNQVAWSTRNSSIFALPSSC
ncbi:hypothetical protein GGI25_005369 [Coemansia spiralis]|uniref:Uncharacterized protein n=2 Tax=Coemansia TaxID=4863 RepID=A0A9W8KWB7_9FUNG|nr:hypothetical protein EDC05_005343 [Coemansia umbellata]KAJ2619673.1 hypothetical protein GGI26_005625 [Coemansia sp. RSA 1358]KAJ2671818.1 hypothetical protein GGI25_005369 [Coemansia spiralis]